MRQAFKNLCALVLTLLFAMICQVHAHEYWLEAEKARVEVGEASAVRLMFGKDFSAGEEKALQLERTASFKLFGQTRKPRSLLDGATEKQKPAATVKAEKEGALLVAMERSTAEIGFAKEKFVSYATAEGHIFAEGELPENIKTVHEHYSRFLKSIVQVGDRLNAAPMRVVGMRYEIVPVGNPFAGGSGKLTFKVLFDGQPWPGATVSAVHRVGTGLTVVKSVTNSAGRCTFSVTNDGHWLIRSVKIKKTGESKETTAEYESFWASLTFAYN